jgi:hypothetical protein
MSDGFVDSRADAEIEIGFELGGGHNDVTQLVLGLERAMREPFAIPR